MGFVEVSSGTQLAFERDASWPDREQCAAMDGSNADLRALENEERSALHAVAAKIARDLESVHGRHAASIQAACHSETPLEALQVARSHVSSDTTLDTNARRIARDLCDALDEHSLAYSVYREPAEPGDVDGDD